VSDKMQALAICSEFSDEYGFDEHDQETLVVFTDSQYINELKDMLDKKNYKLKSFTAYGDDVSIYFVPKKRKK
jgi:hypothetical protein